MSASDPSASPCDATTAAQAAVDRFALAGELLELCPLTRGHIHDTFVSRWRGAEGERRYVHQRMNESVFPDVDGLMENIRRVSEHLVAKLAGGAADGFEPLELVATRDGDSYARTPEGAWRTFVYIENTSSHDRCRGPEEAFEAARAFGWFQAQLADLPPAELTETIPRFFSSPHRYAQFEAALATAAPELRAGAADEIAFAEARAGTVRHFEDQLLAGTQPARVIHGDTKLNNILFDDRTGKAKGIVDLDTCMSGYSLYDFGDLVRFTAATSDEDERDLERVGTDLELYHALAEGYLASARGFLTPGEIDDLPVAARLVTLTIGLRFLADHLAGDVYFKTSRPGHNLDRARVQFGMVRCMEAQAGRMRLR